VEWHAAALPLLALVVWRVIWLRPLSFAFGQGWTHNRPRCCLLLHCSMRQFALLLFVLLLFALMWLQLLHRFLLLLFWLLLLVPL
jgi:hypothetical protein